MPSSIAKQNEQKRSLHKHQKTSVEKVIERQKDTQTDRHNPSLIQLTEAAS